jgi:cytidyltransferase-like protein
MKACGIIVEYNPLHNGHLYHLRKSKELSESDVVIGVTSPNFVQRGEPSIVSKKERVKAALEAGVNIVVELPTLYAVENANIFAKYALQILNGLKVNSICFGSESGDTKEFLDKYSKSSLLTPHLDFLVSDLMDEGYAYPKAMAMALKQMDEIRLETPNDILGLAYYNEIKNNNYPMEIHTIKRVNNYNDDSLNYENVSAKAIRAAMKNNVDVKDYTPMDFSSDLFYLDEYFSLLKYKILTMSVEELNGIHLMEEGIENLFKKKIVDAHNMNEFINLCVSKRYTFARIKRTIIHILLNTKKDFAKEMLNQDIKYIRLLGIDSKGSDYLKEKRKDIEIPVLSKFRGNSFALLQYEKQATYTYACIKTEEIRSKLYEEEHFLFPIRVN